MKPEIKKIWCDALRSKEFTQGFGQLRAHATTTGPFPHPEAHCCLGVLCELHKRAGLGEWDGDSYDGENSTELPPAVREWAGLDQSNPILKKNWDDPLTCVSANDADKLSFDEIADRIEEAL